MIKGSQKGSNIGSRPSELSPATSPSKFRPSLLIIFPAKYTSISASTTVTPHYTKRKVRRSRGEIKMVTPWSQPTSYDYNRREQSFDLHRRDGPCCGSARCSSPHSHHHQSLRVGPFGERRPSVISGHHAAHHVPHHPDSRASVMADREEEHTPPRKRIAVAVGRLPNSFRQLVLICHILFSRFRRHYYWR